MDDDRLIPLEGVRNFRDYGGYDGRGGRLRRGRLFRSGQHGKASDADLDRLDRLDLKLVVDLRGGGERAKSPCRRSPRFAGEILLVDADTAGLAPHIAAARARGDDAYAAMCEGYRAMPFRPVLIDIMTRYFAALATTDGASLVHCAAGKDRTGLAVALLHDLLGVHADDAMADYLLTNAAVPDPVARLDGVRAIFGQDMNEDAVRALLSVHPAYLAAAFDAIRHAYGSLDAYRREVLGVTPTLRDQIARQLLE